MLRAFVLLLTIGIAVPASAQSLFTDRGSRAVEGSVGWSVGPSSNGVETHISVSLDGRTDVGLGISRYTLTFDDGSKSSFNEYAPFTRIFLVEEESGAPLSLSLGAQLFVGDYGPGDSGKYVQAGPTIYKAFKLSDRFTVYPFAGFAFVAESYRFGGGPTENAQYLTREFGLHVLTPVNDRWLVRMSVVEQSFRRETYRGARIALIGRL
jgi:hypothetical protein